MAKKVAKKKSSIAVSYQRVFNTEDGQTVLKDLMKQYYVMQPTYSRNIDPDELLVREGQRSVVLAIIRMLNIDVIQLRQHIDNTYKEQQEGMYDN